MKRMKWLALLLAVCLLFGNIGVWETPASAEEQKVYTHTKEFIEEQARETYGLLYDGEILFVCGEE